MGLLGEIYSFGNRTRNRLKGLLDDPKGYIQQTADQTANTLRDMSGANETAQQFALRDKINAGDQNALAQYRNLEKTIQNKLFDVALNFNPAAAGIVSPTVAKTLNIAKQMPEDELFKAAVAGTKGAEITDDGLRMMVQRNQAPEQGMMPSVRGGVFYLPEGAAQAKHYSTGKNGYGGAEKIAGETLVTNPLFVKGATGGKAPEAAFDTLNGKGAYQAMRNEALKGYGTYGASAQTRVPAIRSFLEKYAPELSDQAEYISKNSTQGNQLAYALQEAAVGSAVRNAGHDAVLGYSKGKQGPFLSELFDVRESHYPDKFGGYRIHDGLLGEL